MSVESKEDRRQILWQFNLGSLLLLTALAGSAMAYFMARANRLNLTTKMNSMAKLDGRRPVADVSTYRINVDRSADELVDLWVPRHGRLKLFWSTGLADNSIPAYEKPIVLDEGRHSITVGVRKDQVLLLVDNQVVFSRRYAQDWNVASPAAWEVAGDYELTDRKTVIMSAAGVATLRSDEVYDAAKHRFGLKVWLER